MNLGHPHFSSDWKSNEWVSHRCHYHPIPSIYLQFSETMTERILPRIFFEKTLAHQGAEEALLSTAKERNQKIIHVLGVRFFDSMRSGVSAWTRPSRSVGKSPASTRRFSTGNPNVRCRLRSFFLFPGGFFEYTQLILRVWAWA